MATVGLREFKNKFSKSVKRASNGKNISITNRGHMVVELIPAKRLSQAGKPMTTLDELRRKGALYGTVRNSAKLYPAMPRVLKRSVSSSLLDEERGSR